MSDSAGADLGAAHVILGMGHAYGHSETSRQGGGWWTIHTQPMMTNGENEGVQFSRIRVGKNRGDSSRCEAFEGARATRRNEQAGM